MNDLQAAALGYSNYHLDAFNLRALSFKDVAKKCCSPGLKYLDTPALKQENMPTASGLHFNHSLIF